MGIEVYFILFFLTLGLCLFWSLFFRSIKNAIKRKIIIILLSLASAPIIYVGLALLFFFAISYYPNRDFDKEKWKTDPEKRYELTKDLINSKILIGKTKAEVIQVLGIEDNEDRIDNWSYYVGFKPMIVNIDPDVLEIFFKNGKVVLISQRPT